MPFAAYDHTLEPPAQWLVATQPRPVIEIVLPKDKVDRACVEAEVIYRAKVRRSSSQRYEGCALTEQSACWVIRIPDEKVRVHERAHCAGWPADHPGGK